VKLTSGETPYRDLFRFAYGWPAATGTEQIRYCSNCRGLFLAWACWTCMVPVRDQCPGCHEEHEHLSGDISELIAHLEDFKTRHVLTGHGSSVWVFDDEGADNPWYQIRYRAFEDRRQF